MIQSSFVVLTSKKLGIAPGRSFLVVLREGIYCQTSFHGQVYAVASSKNAAEEDHILHRSGPNHGKDSGSQEAACQKDKGFPLASKPTIRGKANGIADKGSRYLTHDGQKGDSCLGVILNINNIMQKVEKKLTKCDT